VNSLCEKWGLQGVSYCSAKDGDGVAELAQEAVNFLLTRAHMPGQLSATYWLKYNLENGLN
jgi:hypothetical protein